MSDKVVTVHNASLQTATVEIKILRVSGKQMTLSVFRQLPSKEIPDLGESLESYSNVIWGWVNYCPDQEKYCRDIHYVYSVGGVLYKDYVEPGGLWYTSFRGTFNQLYIAV